MIDWLIDCLVNLFVHSFIYLFSDGVEGEFREQHVRLTFREAVQLFEHRSQFIRRSSNACLVTKHLHYLPLARAGVGRKMYFAVRNPRCSRNIFFHVITVAVSSMIWHSLKICFRGSILYFGAPDCWNTVTALASFLTIIWNYCTFDVYVWKYRLSRLSDVWKRLLVYICTRLGFDKPSIPLRTCKYPIFQSRRF